MNATPQKIDLFRRLTEDKVRLHYEIQALEEEREDLVAKFARVQERLDEVESELFGDGSDDGNEGEPRPKKRKRETRADAVRELFKADSRKQLTISDVVEALEIHPDDRPSLRGTLNALVKQGELLSPDRGVFTLARRRRKGGT